MTKVEKAYVAGIFDAEGCVSAYFDARNNTVYVGASITNTNKDIIEYIQSLFGGYIVSRDHENYKTCYNLNFRSGKIIPFLESILPYLVVKNKQAVLAIEFQKSLKPGTNNLSAEEIDRRKQFLEQLSDLNKTGNNTSGVDDEDKNRLDYILNTKSNHELCAYCAGMIYGDGTIRLSRCNSGTVHDSARVEVKSVNKNAIGLFLKMFGGTIITDSHTKNNWRDIFRWSAGANNIIGVLDNTKDYLRIKVRQANLALQFIATKGQSGVKTSEEVLSQRQHIYNQMRALNGGDA